MFLEDNTMVSKAGAMPVDRNEKTAETQQEAVTANTKDRREGNRKPVEPEPAILSEADVIV